MNTDRRSDMTKITVTDSGWIRHGDELLSPREAAETAHALLDAIRLSQDRNQVNSPNYHDSSEILRRAESPLGQALAATRNVFGRGTIFVNGYADFDAIARINNG
jgi:hypothetical protein